MMVASQEQRTRIYFGNRQHPIFDKSFISFIVARLNENRPVDLWKQRAALRRRIEQWKASGPNLQKLFKEDKNLARLLTHGTWTLFPTSSGYGFIDLTAGPDALSLTDPEHQALEHFFTLIRNPLWYMLGGPCKRCDNYFIKKSKRPRTYCSRTCGAATTAASSMQKLRARRRKERLEQARRWIETWMQKRPKLSSKKWVSRQSRFSMKWLTCAERAGELVFPDQGRETACAKPHGPMEL